MPRDVVLTARTSPAGVNVRLRFVFPLPVNARAKVPPAVSFWNSESSMEILLVSNPATFAPETMVQV